jgi:hypothetical protein
VKVLVISHLYPSTYNPVYGIFVHEQVKALQEKGAEVHVVSPVPWAPFPLNFLKSKWKAYSQIPLKAQWEGVEVSYPRYLAFPKAMFFASSGNRMLRGCEGLIEQIFSVFPFEIIHAHVALPDGFAGMEIAKKYGKPLVVTLHGNEVYVTIDRSAACREKVRKVLSFASKVVLVSDRFKNVLVEKLGHEFDSKLVVVGNGINPEKLRSGKRLDELRERFANHRLLLTVGYLIERKAHKYVLLALKELSHKHPDLKYIIIGSGPKEEELKSLVQQLKLEKKVVFLGLLDHQEVMNYMALSDIFVLPSWNESFGVVYIEAMAHSKPVIACQGEGIEGIVKDKETGCLVEPRNVESLTEALDYLLGHPEEIKAMGEKAQRLVLNNFTWAHNAVKMQKIYEETIEGGK